MTETIVVLMILGFALIFLEVFLPGAVAGTIGGILLLVGITLCFREYGQSTGVLVTLGSAVLSVAIVVVGYKLLRKSSFGKSLVLESNEEDFGPKNSGQNVSIGETGVAETDLRPSGIGVFGKRRASVMTDGDYVYAGSTIRVERVESHSLIVKKSPSDPS
jgi:membrane-bound serine protease (ClpP class)